MINLDYLKTTTDNDKETILTLLNMFKSQAPDLKREMIIAFEQKRWYALREAAHKAKNSFQILGMQNEADDLQRLEILCGQEKDTYLYMDYTKRFILACDQAVHEIESGIDLS